ncbi:MAG: isoprenyl transferase [Phycisphaerales bacterium]|nr:MAG: isoprenyl transferase [Phycisphaerales bacterium]
METFEEKLSRTASRLGLAIKQLPRHIAIIMDGNGRWAQQRSLPRVEGHREGAGMIENIAMHCVDIGIESLTLYSFSTENWKRPQSEINALMHIHSEHLVSIRPTLMENNVRLLHLGRVAGLPQSVQNDLAETVEMTVSNTGMKLALALNYSGRVEIVDATRKIAQEFKNGTLSLDEIDEQCVSNHLYGAGLPDPDLLIRTANEMRISNFLLWQISYSEFYVTKTLWPSFTKESLEKAIMAYAKRSRRFGTIETAL